MSACGSENSTNQATVAASPTPYGTPVPPFVSETTQEAQTVTVLPTGVPAPTTTYQSTSDLLSDLGLNRLKWSAAGTADYKCDVKIYCFCGDQGLPLTTIIAMGRQSESMTNS